MTRILVTGGAGFIGANLCERLLKAGNDVVCLDNFFTSSRDKIAHLEHSPNFKLVVGDVRNPIRLDADYIYNLACPASPPKYQRDPIYTTETSVLGAINVLEMARRSGARVLQASTSEIYGEPMVSPQSESYRGNVASWGPRACYDEGKRCAEALFFDYAHQYGVDVRVAPGASMGPPRGGDVGHGIHPLGGRGIVTVCHNRLSLHPVTTVRIEAPPMAHDVHQLAGVGDDGLHLYTCPLCEAMCGL